MNVLIIERSRYEHFGYAASEERPFEPNLFHSLDFIALEEADGTYKIIKNKLTKDKGFNISHKKLMEILTND